jgi:hypothetical protein
MPLLNWSIEFVFRQYRDGSLLASNQILKINRLAGTSESVQACAAVAPAQYSL